MTQIRVARSFIDSDALAEVITNEYDLGSVSCAQPTALNMLSAFTSWEHPWGAKNQIICMSWIGSTF